jgi:hypothetical protein
MMPLMGQREVLGVLVVGHGAVAAFSHSHMALLQTFADQAVIAIENVRVSAVRSARVRRGGPRPRGYPGRREGPRPRLRARRRSSRRHRRRRDAAAPGPPEPAVERGEVHGAGRGCALGERAPYRGRGSPSRADLLGSGHRHRHPGGPARPPVPVVQPGRRVDHTPLRRHRSGSGDQPAADRADGGADRRLERGGDWQRLPLHDPSDGGRVPRPGEI